MVVMAHLEVLLFLFALMFALWPPTCELKRLLDRLPLGIDEHSQVEPTTPPLEECGDGRHYHSPDEHYRPPQAHLFRVSSGGVGDVSARLEGNVLVNRRQ